MRISGESMEAGDETTMCGPAWENDRKEAREEGVSLSPRTWHATLWNWLCPECSGSPSALGRVAWSDLHFRKMTDSWKGARRGWEGGGGWREKEAKVMMN